MYDDARNHGSAPPQGRRVLLIEDNADSAETLAMLLESEGHEVRIASNGAAGVGLAAQWLPDVVVSDLGLPGEVDGYSVARKLKGDARTAGIRLLALSGYADDEAARASLAAGFDAHMAKPVEIDALARWLAGVAPPAVTRPAP